MINRWNYGYANEMSSLCFDPSLLTAPGTTSHTGEEAVPFRERRDRLLPTRSVRLHAQRYVQRVRAVKMVVGDARTPG